MRGVMLAPPIEPVDLPSANPILIRLGWPEPWRGDNDPLLIVWCVGFLKQIEIAWARKIADDDYRREDAWVSVMNALERPISGINAPDLVWALCDAYRGGLIPFQENDTITPHGGMDDPS